MLFKDVIGQAAVKQQLTTSVKEGWVSHTQLLLGQLGYGGLPIALAFAQYLNCEAPSDNDSCGTCPSCLKSQRFIHPDIHFSYPFASSVKDKRAISTDLISDWRGAISENTYLDLNEWMQKQDAENKQGNIPVKECHDIIRKLSMKAFESKYKVMIIWLPEYLGASGNVLLKILEEPPENTVFLLVAQEQDAILNTILSRTQILKLPPISREDLSAHLVSAYAMNEQEAQRVAAMSRGSFRLARGAAEHSVSDHITMFQNWITLCATFPVRGYHQKIGDILALVEDFSRMGREVQKAFFEYALHFIRESMQMMLTDVPSQNLIEEELAFVARLNNKMDPDKYQELYELCNRSFYHLERNANPKAMMLNVSVKVGQLMTRRKADKING